MKKNNDWICDSCGRYYQDFWSENDEIVTCDMCHETPMRRKFMVSGISVSVGSCGNASTSYSGTSRSK